MEGKCRPGPELSKMKLSRQQKEAWYRLRIRCCGSVVDLLDLSDFDRGGVGGFPVHHHADQPAR